MTRKLTTYLLIALLLFTLASCKNGESRNETTAAEQQSPSLPGEPAQSLDAPPQAQSHTVRHEYTPSGVCARKIEFSLVHTGDVITISDVVFTGGCAGNAKGIAALVEGLSVDEVISTLEDVPCGNRGTSCPAQLALALREALDAD